MTLRSLSVLAVATALSVILAAVSSTSFEGSTLSDRGKKLLPDFATAAGRVAEIIIRSKDNTTTISKKNGVFVDASGYPVKTEAVRDLMTSLSVLTIVENKTNDPSRYGDLNLAEPGAENGSGTEIAFADDSGNDIARIVVGRSDYTVGGTAGGQYVRTANSDLSYLVRGSVKLPLTRVSWFEAVLLETEKEDIESLTVRRKDGAAVEFRRDGDELAMVDRPTDREIDAGKLDRLTGLFGKLDFVDVRPASATDKDHGGAVGLVTRDGLAVTVTALGSPGDREQWARISVESLRDETKLAAQELAEKVEGLEFRLPAGDLAVLDWTADDFLVSPQS